MLFARLTTAKTIEFGPVLDSAGAEHTGAVVADVQKILNGAAAAALDGSATLTSVAVGVYRLALTANDISAVGEVTLFLNKTTYVAAPVRLNIVPTKVYDSLVAGSLNLEVDTIKLSGTAQTARDLGLAIPAVVAGASGGLPIVGTQLPLALTVNGNMQIDNIGFPSYPTVDEIRDHFDLTHGDGTWEDLAYARLGAPAGASVSADIAAVKVDTGNLVTRITSTLFSGITYLSKWLGLLAGKTADAGTLAELTATTAGAGYLNTTDSLEAIRDRGDAAWITGSTSVVVPAAVAAASQTDSLITIVRGDTLRRSFLNIGDLTTRTKLWFTLKASEEDTDAEAIIQITEAGGLLVLNGAVAADSALGSIVVDDVPTGDITIYIDETLTDDFDLFRGYIWDVQWKSAADTTTPLKGVANVSFDVTRAVV